ncbi:MAG: class I poly(R)-hydroxyalkanoic acid synthase [Noviherbaspirillum sp.]
MKTPSPQDAANAWLANLSDPRGWQAWLPPAAVPPVIPGAPQPQEMPVSYDAGAFARLQQDYMREFTGLWQSLLAAKAPPVADKRFATPAWQGNALHAFQAAAYLLNARFLVAMADTVEAPPKVRQKLRFTIQQAVDAMSPANFLVSNPEAQQKLIETRGESLARGIVHMLTDLQKGRISHTDESAFEVGRNVATSEGAVVFENPLFQLIQYKPATRMVRQRPLLIVPPCINKYYILDLQPSNSLVRYAVEQGHTVFLVSWRNPDASLGHATWEDYIEDAVLRAIEVVREISGQERINTLGFCVGGTLLATALAVLAARGDQAAASVTLLTSLLDFSDTGVLEVYIDEAQVARREQEIGQGGLMLGSDFASAFSSLRPNDLIWNYVESNYLKGEDPAAFDLLYWNADSTNLPGPMFCWYLRNLYLENSLKVPGRLTVGGEAVDLGSIGAPAFIYASREDHIVPWTAAYASMGLLNPKKPAQNRFILGASGHIAGVINPPEKKKRSYWKAGGARKGVPGAQEWLDGTTEQPGSWWPEWADFLAAHGGKEVRAPSRYGNVRYKPIEAAPGRYVKAKA